MFSGQYLNWNSFVLIFICGFKHVVSSCILNLNVDLNSKGISLLIESRFSFSSVTVLALHFSLPSGCQLNVSWTLRGGWLQRSGESKQHLLISSGIYIICDLLPLGT